MSKQESISAIHTIKAHGFSLHAVFDNQIAVL